MPSSPRLAERVPFLLDIEMDSLSETRKVITGNVIVCSKCGAYLDNPGLIETGEIGRYYKCPYCGTTNIIPKDAQIVEPDSDILISEAKEQKTEYIKHSAETIVALIDISGSMGGAKLKAVKESLIKSINSIVKTTPDTYFYLVPFETSVYIVDPISGEFYKISEDLEDETRIGEQVLKILERIKPERISEVAENLKTYVFNLREMGSTALGPAVVTGFTILKKHEGGRLLLLTDGMANVGIGSLDAYPSQEKFYKEMATKLKNMGMIVDVIGVRSHGEIGLDKIGVLAEITEGDILYPDISEIEASMGEAYGKRIIGRDVKIRIIAPPEIKISDASGISDKIIEDLKTKHSAKIGMMTEGRELMLAVKPKTEIKRKKVPIQIQMEYVDSKGAKKVRVLSTEVDVTSKEDEILESLDAEITTTFVVQKAGEHEYRGEEKRRKAVIKQAQQLLNAAAQINAENAQAFRDAIEIIENTEKEFEEAKQMRDEQVAQGMKARRVSKAKLFKK